ncbi:hypothetical protein BDW59DRAFT_137809 [Aspergillus cavernicola]|uniref:Uncharacterized protein n=1 Tax=Aspergillus cavernicola TaxID=176166 RepID=A0ABR4J300_9EURO
MDSASAQSNAFLQLSSEQLELLELINKLNATGDGQTIELPQIALCGYESSGKSSLLEALAEITFLTAGREGTLRNSQRRLSYAEILLFVSKPR